MCLSRKCWNLANLPRIMFQIPNGSTNSIRSKTRLFPGHLWRNNHIWQSHVSPKRTVRTLQGNVYSMSVHSSCNATNNLKTTYKKPLESVWRTWTRCAHLDFSRQFLVYKPYTGESPQIFICQVFDATFHLQKGTNFWSYLTVNKVIHHSNLADWRWTPPYLSETH